MVIFFPKQKEECIFFFYAHKLILGGFWNVVELEMWLKHGNLMPMKTRDEHKLSDRKNLKQP